MLMAPAFSADYHIGLYTSTVSQGEDEVRGAEALIKEYGAVRNGGIIQHITMPDDYMEEQETTISEISGFSDDRRMRAVVVTQGVPGTTEAFREIYDMRSDIMCIAAVPHEDPSLITSSADLAVSGNFVAEGYLQIKTAAALGCKVFVHISFPRHLSMESVMRSKAIMEEACKDFGIRFVSLSSPDPLSEDVGVAGAQQFIMENVPIWLDRYGQDTAFYCTNDAQIEPLIAQVLKYGGYIVNANLLSYPGALGIDLKDVAGDFEAMLSRVEETVIAKGGAGRLGTSEFSDLFTYAAGLGQLAINGIEAEKAGQTFDIRNIDNIEAAFMKYTPGCVWTGENYIDSVSGVTYHNLVLFYQDTYIFGQGFMGNDEVDIPEKYRYITGQ